MPELIPDHIHQQARAGVDIVTLERLEQLLDNLCAAKEREVIASVNASSCRTRWDFRQAQDMEVAFLEARDLTLDALCELLPHDR